MIVEHLAYDTLEGRYDTTVFTENQTKQDLSRAGSKLKRHIYDYAETDSKTERDFVTELDTSEEVVVSRNYLVVFSFRRRSGITILTGPSRSRKAS